MGKSNGLVETINNWINYIWLFHVFNMEHMVFCKSYRLTKPPPSEPKEMEMIMSKHKFKVGDTVKHDFSPVEGEILKTCNNREGYDYLIRWTGYTDDDWYQESALRPLTPTKNEPES